MKKVITNTGIGAIIALCSFAIPVQASTIIAFNDTTTGGTVCTAGNCGTAAGSGGTLTSMTDKALDGFTVSVNGGPAVTWLLSGASFSYSAGTYTLTAGMSCATSSVCGSESLASQELLSFAGNAPTYTGSLSFTISSALQNATSITETTAFLTDLDLTIPTTSGTTFTDSAASTNSNAGAMTLSASSSMTLNTSQTYATPEPVSFLLLGSGLLAVALIARRKAPRTASVPVV